MSIRLNIWVVFFPGMTLMTWQSSKDCKKRGRHGANSLNCYRVLEPVQQPWADSTARSFMQHSSMVPHPGFLPTQTFVALNDFKPDVPVTWHTSISAVTEMALGFILILQICSQYVTSNLSKLTFDVGNLVFSNDMPRKTLNSLVHVCRNPQPIGFGHGGHLNLAESSISCATSFQGELLN